MNSVQLKGKVAIITGSTRGIGLAIAEELITYGVRVVINGTNSERVDQVVTRLRQSGGEAIGIVGYVEQMETGRNLVDTALRTFGRVDFVINNAGVVADRMSHRMTEEEWDQVMLVNAKGAFSCTQPFIQHVRATGQTGVIINMISLAGLVGTFGQLNYSAAKGAMLAMTYTWAQEYESLPLRVHAVAPAALTDMTRPYVEKAQEHADQQGVELPEYWRIGTAEDVAQFVGWLITHPVETGTVFGINGKQAVQWSQPVSVAFTDYNKA